MTLGKGVHLIYTAFPHNPAAGGPFTFHDPNSAGEVFNAIKAANSYAKANYKPHEVAMIVQLVDNFAWGESCPVGTHPVTTTNADGTTTTTCVPD